MLFFLVVGVVFFINVESIEHNYKPLVHFIFGIFGNYSAIAVLSTNVRFNEQMYELNAEDLRTTISLFNTSQDPRQDVAHGIVTVSDNWEDILEMKKRARNGAVVVVVMEQNTSNITEFFSLAWYFGYKDIVIVHSSDMMVAYAYNPFLNQVQQFNIDQVDQIVQFSVSRNYYGVVIKGTLFDTSPITVFVNGVFIGVDSMLIEAISEQLNVTIETHVPLDGELFGYRDHNGSSSGAIRELYSKESQMAFNQIFVKDYDAPDLTFTNVISDDCLCVIAPKAKLIPKWTAILYAFPTDVWAALFFIVSLVTIGLFIIRKYSSHTQKIPKAHAYDHSWSTVCLDVCQALFNVTYSKAFSNKFQHRLVLGVLCLYGLIINALFQSSLVTVNTSQKHYPEIDTLQQLAESNYHISTYALSLTDVFNNTGNRYMETLSERLHLLKFETPPLPAFLSRRLKHDFLISLRQTGAQDFHMVQECVRSFRLAYLVHQDAYFLQDINTIISNVVAAGLIDTWRDMVKLNLSDVLFKNKYIEERIEFPRPVNVADLQTSFYILIVGFTIGYVIFLVEYFSGRCYYLS